VNHPILYEINTRCWLRELSEQQGGRITLANVPEAEFTRWRRLGFTHLWLMGVWTTGPRCRALSLKSRSLQDTFNKILPGWTEDDVPGSPYAIGAYEVPAALGGEAGLKTFREKLNAVGLKLLLDFVPNHVGLDFSWVTERPQLFVQSPVKVPGTSEQQTSAGPRWLAHGKDPNFPLWSDTVQLDYRRTETRAAMIELLQSVARRCDGVRCDMAMLLLNDIFIKTWAHFPTSAPDPNSEFWPEAISSIKKTSPNFLFLAEVYWDLESRLQSLDFDYTYDKTVYDRLIDHHYADLQKYLLDEPPEQLARGAHFLENHDERRIASILSPGEHRAAALLMLSMPGMRFLYEGQLEGWRIKVPVQLGRWPKETTDAGILALYEQMLGVLKDSAIGHGQWKLLRPTGWRDNNTPQNFCVIQWQKSPSEFDLVVVNLASHSSQCRVHPVIKNLAARDWEMRDLLGKEIYQRHGGDMESHGLHLDLPANGARLFHFK
jgi:glycosidase